MDKRIYSCSKFIYLIFRWPIAKSKRLIFLLVLAVVLSITVSCNKNSLNNSSDTPFFPVQKASGEQMLAELQGKLVSENDCLRVDDGYSNYLIIWPHGFSMRTEGEEIQVLDSNRQVVARVGDYIYVSGGAFEGEQMEEHVEKNVLGLQLPDDCQGPYWIVGDTVEVMHNESALDTESSDLEPFNETNKEAELFFAEDYARIHKVTVDEAMERLRLQDIAGELSEELITKEANTLAGYWIEHTPKFKLVILFTRDAEKTIEPYLQKYKELADIIEIGTAELSLVELQNIQDEVTSSAWNLGIPTASEVDVYENCVKVYVEDRVQFDKAVSEGKLVLPDCVEVITVESLIYLEND